LHGDQQVAVLALLQRGQRLQQLQQRGAVVPVGVERLGHVVATQGGDGDDAGDFDACLLGKRAQRFADGIERLRWVRGRIELVDGEDDAGHAQQVREQRVAARLRQQWHGLLRRVQLGDVNQHHGGIAAGGCRHHVARVLLVARGVGNDELALLGGEVAVGDVDRDALLALGLQAVGQQRQVDRLAGSLLLQRVELVGQDGAAVVQQATDEGALAVVHAACGEKAQGAVVFDGGC
jgi:hypothetical protein